MRPSIPDSLAERIEENYEEAGYASKTEFVNDAIRRRLERVEEE
jgi:metal-responsive CopG/Arc/MetJ family transcriptional regulator